MLWFLGTLGRAVSSAQTTLDAVLIKARFWQRWAGTSLNERQLKLLNRLLDGFEGRLTSSKWAAIAKCSPETALRDITQLLDVGVLLCPVLVAGSGRYVDSLILGVLSPVIPQGLMICPSQRCGNIAWS